MPDREIEDRFLATYLEDARADRVRPLTEYQSLFPGHETTIAREYRLLEVHEHGDAVAALPESLQSIGRYRVRHELGRGSQARVYLAFDPKLGRDVALKVLEVTRFGLDVETRMQRFLREAALTARLDHPGICSVLDVGEDDTAEVLYIAMRYVEGRTLAEWITGAKSKRDRPSAISLPIREDSDHATGGSESSTASRRSGDTQAVHRVLEVVEKMARALHVAHEQGLVHRDIKPGNVMIGATGEPVILDFGLARDAGSDELGLTMSGDVLGTPYYMSPEQVRGKHRSIDRRTDVYSLGVVLHECLTLRRPFEAGSREALYRRILDEPPPDPRRLNGGIPSELRIVLETAMEKERARRYPTALAFADDLRRVRRYQPIHAQSLPLRLRAQRWMQRNPRVTAVVGVLAVALVIATWLLLELRASNARLERIRVAGVLREVAESIDAATGAVRPRRESLTAVPVDQQGFAWTWLDARNEPPPPVFRKETSTPIRAVAFGADNESLLAVRLSPKARAVGEAPSDGELWRLCLESGAWTQRIGPAFTLAMSPTRDLFVTGSAEQGAVTLHDATTHEQLDRALHGDAVTAVCFARDGKLAASGGEDGSIRIWRVERTPTGSNVLQPGPHSKLSGFGATIRALDFSPDADRLVVSGHRFEASIIDLRGLTENLDVPLFTTREQGLATDWTVNPIPDARFSPDGQLLALAGQHGLVKLFDAKTARMRQALRPHFSPSTGAHLATRALFDPTGRLLITCGFGGNVQVHDVRSGQRLGHIFTGGHHVAAAIASDGVHVAVAQARNLETRGSGVLSVWHLGDLPLPTELVGDQGGEGFGEAHRFAISRDRRHVFTVDGRCVRKFDLATGELIFALPDYDRAPRCVALRPNDERELAIGYSSGDLHIVDSASGELLRDFRAKKEIVWPNYDFRETGFYCLGYAPDGRTLAGGIGTYHFPSDPKRECPVMVFDAATLELVRPLHGHRLGVTDLHFNRDGSRMVTLDYHRRLVFWDTTRWSVVRQRQVSGSTRLAVDAADCVHVLGEQVLRFDFATGQRMRPSELSAKAGLDMEAHPHSKEVVILERTGPVIWDASSGKRLLSLPLKDPIQGTGSVRFLGARDLIFTGGISSHWLYESAPRRDVFQRRQIESAACRTVQSLLDAGYTKREARRTVRDDRHLLPDVRSAAHRVLKVTRPDHHLVMVHAFRTLIVRGLSRDRYAVAARRLEEIRLDVDPDRFGGSVNSLLALAHYRLNQDRDALEAMRRFGGFPRPDYPGAWAPKFVRDFQSTAYFFGAMAAHRLGRVNAKERFLEQAWAHGIGGQFDLQAFGEADALFGLRAKRPPSPAESAWSAVGPPDANRHVASPDAWYPATPDTGVHAIQLDYEKAMHVKELRVYQVNVPGAVVAFELLDAVGKKLGPWKVTNPDEVPWTIVIKPQPEVSAAAKSVRLHIDASRRKGRNGIDTVRMVGTDGTAQWPISARTTRPPK